MQLFLVNDEECIYIQKLYYVRFALAFCMIASLPYSVLAQEPPETVNDAPNEPLTFDEMLVLDGQSYAKIYGVSLEEGMRRVLVMHDTTEAINALSGEFAGKIGGQYFTHGADFGLKMRLTGSEKKANRIIGGNKALRQERPVAR